MRRVLSVVLLILALREANAQTCVLQGCLLPRAGGGDEQCINQLLSAGQDVILCPTQTYLLNGPIRYRFNGQKIFTQGKPASLSNWAKLVVNGRFATAVNGTGKSNVELSYLRIDGGARQFGPGTTDRGALVELGGAGVAGILVTNTELAYPQGWSCLHLFEGRRDTNGYGQCGFSVVTNNYIHDAGIPQNLKWADGISMACEGVVSGNTVRNVTDVGIVLFVNNITVENNLIENTNTLAFGAISMGAYRNQLIRNNTIRQGTYYSFSTKDEELLPQPNIPPCDPDCWPEEGGRFDVAIAVGRPTWSHCNGTYSDATGTQIVNNYLVARNATYRYGGYGIAVARVSNIVIAGNSVSFTPSGRGAGCSGNLPDPARAFQYMECSACSLQPEFQPASSLWNLLMNR